MRTISPVNPICRGRGSITYPISPVSSIRHQNVLDVGQAYNFQNAESGSTVHYGGPQNRDSGVVEVDGLLYRYDMDSRERVKVRNMLERQKNAGKTRVEIGKYLFETYNRRDRGLGGMVTYLVGKNQTYDNIAAFVMKAVGLDPPVQQSFRPQSAYASPKPTRQSPNGPALSQFGADSPAGTPVKRAVNPKYIFEDDDEPPLLQPATINRIQRGYFDPKLDWGKK
ncbi:hypothetical protein MGYG_08337 [Nannizzia gypsea CBS 118893]|uniref:Uncharacterized protein n=1 Tax=Arthroderma gypseum (strain ATCC MYA-4604 / CBS 118893) TaxID=535722 RepID=E4V5F1_ARTGP|nr:hypothetical protein MGYG_08337 [Nannizzia gypsea CBS 118893]EFR05326.1 hypothetical protein MGYG_08337 [Nannizzia gypsea CBS 118893]